LIGVVEFNVPFQQYLVKHVSHAVGTVVPVLYQQRLSVAHATQTPQSESTVPLPIVATLYPFCMIASFWSTSYDTWYVETLDWYEYGEFGTYTIKGDGPVILLALHPKKVGCWLRPRLTMVFWSGIAGNSVPLAMPDVFRLRWYVATRAVAFGQ